MMKEEFLFFVVVLILIMCVKICCSFCLLLCCSFLLRILLIRRKKKNGLLEGRGYLFNSIITSCIVRVFKYLYRTWYSIVPSIRLYIILVRVEFRVRVGSEFN